jgi:hypothetical protein
VVVYYLEIKDKGRIYISDVRLIKLEVQGPNDAISLHITSVLCSD